MDQEPAGASLYPYADGAGKERRLQDGTKGIALDFAKQSFELTRDERTDAETKSADIVDVARSVLSISRTEAQAYFDEALTVAGSGGEENLWRWDAMLDLAERAARHDRPTPETAYQLARCAELTWDYVVRDFDWRSTVEALSSLCPRSCVAILSRWRDRNFGSTGRILPVAVHALLEHGWVDPRDALALIGFEAEWDYPRLLSSVLDACANRTEKEAATSLLIRYAQVAGSPASAWLGLKEITARHGLSVPGLDGHLSFAARQEHEIKERSAEQRDGWSADKPPTRQWDDIFSGKDLATADGISRSYADFKATPAPWSHDGFFAEALRRVPVGDEAAFIASAGLTPVLGLYDLRTILERIPDTWKGRPAVKYALAGTLKSYCRRYCMKIDRSRHYEVLPFDLAGELTGLDEADISDLVLDAVGESSDLADARRLFSMVGLLKSMISDDEALDALKFGLRLFEPILDEKDGDGPWSKDLLPPDSMVESVAGYVYSGLAAPTAAVRWEAAHVVRGLCALAGRRCFFIS